MTLVGKTKLDHPALGTAGGGTLHAAIESVFENISDHLSARWRLFESVANSATTVYEHNLQVPLADLRVHLYTKGMTSNSKVPDLAAAGWSVVATTGFEQTQLDITAPSTGGPFDFYVYVSHEPMNDKLSLSGGTMTGTLVLSGDPTQPSHAASKSYVDTVAQGLDVKPSVTAATTANITLSGAQTINGVAVVAGNRVLVKSQTTASQNGIYVVGAGAWSRADDMSDWATEVPGAFVFVEEGGLADTGWVCTSDQGGTIGTSAINWNQFAGVGNYTATEEGIKLTGTQFALDLDGNSLSESASGLKVNPAGDITAASLSSGVINSTGYQDYTGVSTPASPASGKTRVYSKTDGKLYTQNPAGIESAVGSGGSIVLINKNSHGFLAADVGCPVYLNASGDYVKAKADAANTAEVAGLINKRIDADYFEVCLSGEVTDVGANAGTLVAGTVYFLSATTAGALTEAEPVVIGQVSKPLGVARTTTSIDFFNQRGMVVGGANARTQINLANNTPSQLVQNVSAYEAGELAGWVLITNSTTANSKRFYVQAPFAKYGGSPNYYISPSFVGDTPPVGFTMTVTAGGLIQVTMPNVSGYVSAVINFALNAPAVGTNFPLSVDGTQITGGLVPAANLPVASASASGIVSTGAQTLAGVKTFSNLVTCSDSSLVASGNLWASKEYTGSSATTIVTIDTGISATNAGVFSCCWFWGSNVNNGAGVCTFGYWGFLAAILVGGTTTVNAGSLAFSNSSGQIRVTLTAPSGSNNTQVKLIINGKYF